MSSVRIAERFAGPPGCANGGYVAGLLSRRFPEGHPLEVTLKLPVPLDAELEVADGADGTVELLDRGQLLASAAPAEDPQVGFVPEVGLHAARGAARAPAELKDHPFPGCFGCGPRRDPAEAVALHPGPLRARPSVWATAWTPPEGLPHDDEGVLDPEIAWVALDCPSSFGTVPEGSPPHVLGRLQGRVDAPLHVGEELIVLSWPLDHRGRRRWGASAILGADGELRAMARATWVELR